MTRRPTDITGSRRRRRRARAVRTFLRGLAVLAALAIVSGAVWAVGFSPALAATGVEVRGVVVLTSDQVAEVAAVPLGLPMVRLATGPIAGRVTTLSPVATVDVTRRWPHTVVITVTERHPVYFLRRADGTGSLGGAAPPRRVRGACCRSRWRGRTIVPSATRPPSSRCCRPPWPSGRSR